MEPLVPAVKLVFQLDGMLQETSQSAITCLKWTTETLDKNMKCTQS